MLFLARTNITHTCFGSCTRSSAVGRQYEAIEHQATLLEFTHARTTGTGRHVRQCRLQKYVFCMSTGELNSLSPIQVQLCYFGKDQDTPQHSQRVFHNTSIETQLFVFTCIYMHIIALNLPDHSPKLSLTSECIMVGIWQNKPRFLQQNKMLCAFEYVIERHVPMPTDARCRARTPHTHRRTNK